MAQPLALFLYEKLLPSGQLVNRFQDKGYRVQSIGAAATLLDHADREKRDELEHGSSVLRINYVAQANQTALRL